MYRRVFRTWVMVLALAVSLTAPAQSTSGPEITAQGFGLSEPQVGRLGKIWTIAGPVRSGRANYRASHKGTILRG